MIDALTGVLEPKPELFAKTHWFPKARQFDWLRWAWVPLPVAGVLVLLFLFVILPRLRQPVHGNPAASVVACPAVSPSPPQLEASPNPVAVGEPISFSGSGFVTGDPLFVVIDGAGDCSNPTAGTKVFNTSSYTDPLATDPSPLPDSLGPGSYQLRACNQRPGESPVNCVQVPLSVTAAASSARAVSQSSRQQSIKSN